LERLRDVADPVLRLGGIAPRGAQDRAALEVDAREVVDVELDDVGRVALHEPLEAVVAAEDAEAVVASFDGRRRDDRVDPRGGPAADQDRERFHGAPSMLLARSTRTRRPMSLAEWRNGGEGSSARTRTERRLHR